MKKINWKEANKPKLFAILFFLTFISYFIFGRFFFIDMNKNFKYSIGQIKGISAASRTSDRYVDFEFQYENKIFHNSVSFPVDSVKFYNLNISKRFLIKMSDKDQVNKLFSTYKLYIEKPVPDTIKFAPIEGWKQLPKWAK